MNRRFASPKLAVSVSPRKTLKLPGGSGRPAASTAQCAAVRSFSSETTVPPQEARSSAAPGSVSTSRKPWAGYSPADASVPLTIRPCGPAPKAAGARAPNASTARRSTRCMRSCIGAGTEWSSRGARPDRRVLALAVLALAVIAGEARGPPDPRAEVEHERRHEHGAHDERVEQHAERDHEADLQQEDEGQYGQHGERPGQHDARRRDHRAGHREAAQHARARSVAQRLLAHARHQEDVVVD